jgi:hypothetical protein
MITKSNAVGIISIDGRCDKCGQLSINNTSSICSQLIWVDYPDNKESSKGLQGWVCPVCGAGVSFYTSVCPCNKKPLTL